MKFMIDGIGLLVFAIVLRYFGKYDWSVKLATFLVVGVSFLFTKLWQLIFLLINSKPLIELLAPVDIVVALLQIPVTLIAFTLMRNKDDSIAAWFTIAAVGIAVNYALIPFVVPMFVPLWGK